MANNMADAGVYNCACFLLRVLHIDKTIDTPSRPRYPWCNSASSVLSDVMRWMRWKTICEFLGRKYRYFSFSYEDLSFTWVLRKMISSWNAKELAAAANWSVNCGKVLGNCKALGLGILPNMVVFIPETLPTVFLCGVGFLTSIDFSAFIRADGFRHAVKCRFSWVS